ncbi:MAG: Arc family DNA-binding protein [Treponema sp.]|jgi:hypothetical protein|nr:Arc family DNA-binding protein [Treponema sp.]
MGEKKKQVPLRLSDSLWKELAAWAEDEFRSVNGQIECLLTEAVRRRKKGKKSDEAEAKADATAE